MHRILSLAAVVAGLGCLALVGVGAQGRGQQQVAMPDGPGSETGAGHLLQMPRR